MSDWSLAKLLSGVHDDIERQLAIVRGSIAHPTAKGDGAEKVWLELLGRYLPRRYQAERAHIVDSEGVFSQQIDVVIFDRHYSPFIFDYQGQKVVAAESVYASFEAKQAVNAAEVEYAQDKIQSVRRLHRTSLPIPHAGGMYPPKPLHDILGGLLVFESDWIPPMGDRLTAALEKGVGERRLDLGCVAAHGTFTCDSTGCYAVAPQTKAAAAFLLELIARLQGNATVPMVDIRAYARWLAT